MLHKYKQNYNENKLSQHQESPSILFLYYAFIYNISYRKSEIRESSVLQLKKKKKGLAQFLLKF